jgi:hypothetical protein
MGGQPQHGLADGVMDAVLPPLSTNSLLAFTEKPPMTSIQITISEALAQEAAAGVPPMAAEAIEAEIAAYRAERRRAAGA